MKRDIYDCGENCQLAFNLDRLCAIDVNKDEGKWCLRLFFSGMDRGYILYTDSKEIAEGLYNDIVSRMKKVED